MPAVNFPQTVHTWMFGETPFSKILEYLRDAGADGLDLSIYEAGPYAADHLLDAGYERLIAAAGMKVFSTTPLYFSPDADLSSADPARRRKALLFTKKAVDVTARYGCDRMLVSPSWVSGTHGLVAPYAEHWKYALEAVSEAAEYAAGKRVDLLIEPINRYRVSLVHTVDEALRFIEDAGLGNLHIVADIFHMHMEEADGVVNALHAAAPHLKCVHIGDSTRRCPGYGVTDWRAILSALARTAYDGPLAYEPVYLYFDEKRVAGDAACAREFTLRLKNGMACLRGLMDRMTEQKGGQP
jgi:D-psicose/D-tagatose/L-ribulose 3-epimerase